MACIPRIQLPAVYTVTRYLLSYDGMRMLDPVLLPLMASPSLARDQRHWLKEGASWLSVFIGFHMHTVYLIDVVVQQRSYICTLDHFVFDYY